MRNNKTMFISANHGFKRHYVYGGAGMFDSTANFFSRLLPSRVAEQLAKAAVKEVAKNVSRRLVEKIFMPELEAMLQKDKHVQ